MGGVEALREAVATGFPRASSLRVTIAVAMVRKGTTSLFYLAGALDAMRSTNIL
jgi:hypothetical protein